MTTLADFKSVKKYLARVGAEPRSLLKAVVKNDAGNGYYTDIAIIKFSRQGDVEAPAGYEPNEEEARNIKVEMSGYNWPETIFIPENDPQLPEKLNWEDVYWFRDCDGNILMGQVRKVNRDKTKSYFPLTKWSDGEYRYVEPEGQLPLFGLEHIKESTTAFLHEGCKGAVKCRDIDPGHPWAEELSSVVHLAWIGGALSPHRTDWSVLKKHGITRVYIVADNDTPGLTSIPKIAQELDCVTISIEFSDQFPRSFDLGDDFPRSMFKGIKGKDYYIGPSFRECCHSATWMTNLVPVIDAKGKEKMVPVLRHHARNLWAYVDELELFVNIEFPEVVRKKENLDAMLTPFSDSRRTSELLLASYTGRTPRLTYRPDIRGRRIVSNGETAINVYVPPSVKPQPGDITPFLDFMEYLIPKESERQEVLRWCATLIARPDIKLSYALLLISEQTGTGKSTLGEKILAPLIGLHNCSFPSEAQITESNFNSWLSKKRLAVVHEIYAGSSFKAANKLKSIITDKFVEINEKYLPEIKLENFVSVYACSNSLKALRIESSDRRWLLPYVTEDRWAKEKFDELFQWLGSGGLNVICDWAHKFQDYVQHGELAPVTDRKREMIEDGRSEAQAEAVALAQKMNGLVEPVSIGYRDIKHWLQSQVRGGKIFDSDQELRRAMKDVGVVFSTKRISLDGREQALAMNKALISELKGLTDEAERVKMAKGFRKRPNEIMEDEF